MRNIILTLLSIGLFIGLATIGLTIAFILMGALGIFWLYLFFTNKTWVDIVSRQTSQRFEDQTETQESPFEGPDTEFHQIIEAEYEVIEQTAPDKTTTNNDKI